MNSPAKKSIPQLLRALFVGIVKVLWNNALVRFSPRQYYLVILTGVKQDNERGYWQTIVVTQRGIVPVTSMVQEKIQTESLQRCCCIGLTRLDKTLARSFYDTSVKTPLIQAHEFMNTL